MDELRQIKHMKNMHYRRMTEGRVAVVLKLLSLMYLNEHKDFNIEYFSKDFRDVVFSIESYDEINYYHMKYSKEDIEINVEVNEVEECMGLLFQPNSIRIDIVGRVPLRTSYSMDSIIYTGGRMQYSIHDLCIEPVKVALHCKAKIDNLTEDDYARLDSDEYEHLLTEIGIRRLEDMDSYVFA